MAAATTLPPAYDYINEWVRFYRNVWGINTFPAPSQDKGKDEKDRKFSWVPWQKYQWEPISDEQQEEWIRNGEYTWRNGIGLIPGKVWFGPNKGKYLNMIDADNRLGIDAVCEMFGCNNLEEVAALGVVIEQHAEDAPQKAHFYFYSDVSFYNLPGIKTRRPGNADYEVVVTTNSFPSLEIRAQGGCQFGTPSFHSGGYRYRQTAGSPPVPTLCLIEAEVADKVGKLEDILNHYGDSYLEHLAADGKTNCTPIPDMWKPGFKVTAGNNRHLEVRRIGASQLIKSRMVNKEQSLAETIQWNKEFCHPPLTDDDVKSGFYKYSVPFAERKLKEHIEVDKLLAAATPVVPTKTPILIERPNSSLLKGYNDDYFEYLIQYTSKTVKQEETLLRQIFYTFLSSYAQQLANNLSLRAPSSEGKTYPIIRALNASGASDNEIITVNHITPTALIYQSGGLLVDKDGKPIRDQVKQLKKDIGRARNRKDWDTLEEKKEQLEKLLEGSAYVLELSGKCFLLLEPPKEGLWDLLKAILSHDKPETRHMMTDKGSQGMATKNVILRGFPAFIFCSAKDESHWEVWEEVQTRFMFTSPNMIPQKYYEGNKLLGKKFGLPNFSKSKIMALGSPEELRLANQCYSWLKHQIKSYYAIPEEGTPVWIPYQDQLTELLPYMRGSDNRVASRLLQLLTVITLCRAHLRYTLIDKATGQRCVIANLEDLQEALHITQNVSGLPPHKLRFYVNTILRLCKQRENELQDKGLPIGKIALTSTEITDFYNKSLPAGAKKYTTDSITKVFLDELHNHNYLEKEQDPSTNRQRYYYYPIVDVDEEVFSALETKIIMMSSSSSSLGRLDKKLHFMRLMLPKNHIGFSKDWLKLQFLQDFDCRVEEPNLKVCDKNGNEVSLNTFIDSYETPDLNLSHFYKRPQDGLYNSKSVEITKTSPSNGGTIVKIITESVQNSETVSSRLNFDQLDKNNGNGKGGSGSVSISASSETKTIAESQPPPAATVTATPTHYIPSQSAQQRQMLLVEAYELERQEQAKINNENKTLQLLNEQRKAIPPDLCKLYEASVSVDPEWIDERDKEDGSGIRRIYAMSFVDWQGREMVFHIDDYKHMEGSLFEQTRAMLNDIFDYWFSNGYRMSFGFNSLGDGSDREVIFENAQYYNTTIQPVEETVVGSHKNRRAYYRFKERELRHTHIDWYRIFKNKAVWTYIFEQKYRTFGLDAISRALFDVGKYKEADGLQAIEEMSIDEQKMYVLQDSRLLSLLTTAENGDLFGALQYIADLLELPLPKVCHSQISHYWTVIYEKMGHQAPQLVDKVNPETGETETIAQNYYFKTKVVVAKRGKNKNIPKVKVMSYSGGRVLEPTPGFYRDVIGLDQESQYPTIGIRLNLGFETMCCGHPECKDDPACQVNYTGDPEIDGVGYYICKLQGDSAYKQKLIVFREVRISAKENGERVKDLALKIIINGAYGVYGYKKFAFADTRVAEVTTAVARKMHKAMEELAKSERYNFNVIGGDTDSIFITYPSEGAADKIGAFCNEFQERYKITIKSSKKYWSKMLITGKKHYIYWEWGNEGNPTIKGMEGAKNNMPKFTNIVFDQFIKNIGADREFISDLKRAWTEEYQYCKKHRPDLLQIEVRLGKNPADYVGDKLIKRLGIHQGKGKDDTIRYYEIGKENEAKYGLDAYLNPEYIDDEIYKQKFFISPFEDALKHLGYDVRKEVFS